jgi:beta-phosphoglucomutase-like phosphatase (HAD superfamily)
VQIEKPLKAVLMDLDGTTVHSEHFWIWIIEKTTSSLLGDPKFKLESCDEPHVSGHSVSEHLQYCVKKYCADKTVEEARTWYFKHTNYEMNEILKGRGKKGAFTPSPGIKEFLYELKAMNVKIGLVTSGLYEKAWPEILNAFQTLGMGDPKEFYDAIITAGHAIRHGEPGTLGELSPKPHPWLYAETMEAAEPHRYVTSASPPLLCIHSKNDHLVLPRQAGAIVATFLSNNVPAELYLFDGNGTSHGIWQRDDVPVDQRQFVAGPGQEMLKFLTSLASAEKKRV